MVSPSGACPGQFRASALVLSLSTTRTGRTTLVATAAPLRCAGVNLHCFTAATTASASSASLLEENPLLRGLLGAHEICTGRLKEVRP